MGILMKLDTSRAVAVNYLRIASLYFKNIHGYSLPLFVGLAVV